LVAALNSPQAGTQPSGVLTSEEEAEALHHFIGFLQTNQAGPTSAPPTLALAEVDSINALKEFLTEAAALQTGTRISITLQALQQLARYLGSVPGRKNVIWFSGSFPMTIFPSPDLPSPLVGVSEFAPEVRKTADLLSASQVALYPVAAQGLANDSVYEANGEEISGTRPSMASQDQVQQLQGGQSDRILGQDTMDELAKDTGGKAFYNGNGLSEAVARAINNGAQYYSLTYTPSNALMDGKYRHIQVKLLKGGKETLAYRRGYFADDLETVLTAGQKPASDPLLTLMGRNLPDYSQILYKVLAEPSKSQPPADAPRIGSAELKGPFVRYSVDFAISVEDLRLEAAPDGTRHGNVEVSLVAYDREGKPLNLVVTPGEISLKPKEYAAVQQGGLQIHKEIDVPKEYVYLRTGIYDLRSSAAGTLGFPLMESTKAGKN
jgi:VWFA-related protein